MLDFVIKEAPIAAPDRSRFAWPRPPRHRRTVVIAIGVAIHGGLLFALLNERLDVSAPTQEATVWTNLEPMSPPPAPSPIPAPISAAVPRPTVVPTARVPSPAQPPVGALVATVPASAASAPLPADSTNAPLRLTLTSKELRELEAAASRTLAQRLARPPASPLLAQRLAPMPQFEEDDDNGIHAVRSHGGCFILIPSGQSQADPFNHGGERVAGRATNDNC